MFLRKYMLEPIRKKTKTLLVISNGEAEDAIACSILAHLDPKIKIIAAPLVSHGKSYTKKGIPLCCPTISLPSRGFNNQSLKAFTTDIKSGLGKLTLKQIQGIWKIRKEVDFVFTCGDVLPQFFGFLTGKPYLSLFTALSEYYIRNQQGLYSSLVQKLEQAKLWRSCAFSVFDRALMKASRCQGVFVRDQWTHEHLKTFGIKSFFLGNPMMDHLDQKKNFKEFKREQKTILLLPGSRAPEVYQNLKQMLKVLKPLKNSSYNIAVNLTSHMDRQKCLELVKDSPLPIHLMENSFSHLLNKADLALAMCGTAAEQAIGKGLPVVSMPGEGPQFILRFAKRQKLLLGDSYFLITEGELTVAKKIEELLKKNKSLFKENSLHRMGSMGGSQKTAEKIAEIFQL